MKIKRINPAHVVQTMDYSDRSSISLHEYYERYPQVAFIPTLTQQNLVGGLLDLQRRKAARREKLRALWRQFIRAFTQPLAEQGRTSRQANPA